MRIAYYLVAILAICAPCSAQDLALISTPLKNTALYNAEGARNEIKARIHSGVYNGYTVDLCIDSPKACEAAVFQPYKNDDGKYSLKLEHGMWEDLPRTIQSAIIREISYYTWGHINRNYNPLVVRINNEPQTLSPLNLLATKSRDMFVTYGLPKYLVGGKGRNAYGPNCWYNSISAIADHDSQYAQKHKLQSGNWKSPRFMGPTEFRQHMNHFEAVNEPKFGDVVRYYTEKPIYEGLIFGGEVHAAIYVGKEEYKNSDDDEVVRHIVLTKNGRSDLDFLILQDIAKLDELYASGIEASDGSKVNKAFFRVKNGSKLFDPATADDMADSYEAYLVDWRNYRKRWACLAGRVPPLVGGSCYSFPKEWELLSTGQRNK